jgi:hypothetical protein
MHQTKALMENSLALGRIRSGLEKDLLERWWLAGTSLDFDQGLKNAVKRLRDALGDSTHVVGTTEISPCPQTRIQPLSFCTHEAMECQMAVCPTGNRICCTTIRKTLAQIVAG